jgi:Mn-containing catalase
MTREIAHQKSFEKALYSIEPNFPPGKLPGDPRFVDTYYDLSVGDGNAVGPWNQGEQWNNVSGPNMAVPVDGGEGFALTGMTKEEQAAVLKLATRTKSNLDKDPVTGADLGAGPGAGSTTGKPASGKARH